MKNIIMSIFLGTLIFAGCCTNENAALHAKLNRLIEKDKIIEVVNKLFISTDNRDWEKVKECFAADVIFDMTSMAGGEPSTLSSEEIVDAWDQGLRALKAIHHQAGNYLVIVNGDESDVFCYGIAFHYLPNKTGEDTRTFVGSYDFHLKKKADNWHISKFKYNLKYISGNLELEKS